MLVTAYSPPSASGATRRTPNLFRGAPLLPAPFNDLAAILLDPVDPGLQDGVADREGIPLRHPHRRDELCSGQRGFLQTGVKRGSELRLVVKVEVGCGRGTMDHTAPGVSEQAVPFA